MTTPWQRYQADLQREGFSHDPAQEEAVRLLQDLYERLLQRHGQLTASMPRILELNPDHAIIKKLSERAASAGADGGSMANDALLQDAAHLLLDQARIADGEPPADPVAFSRRISSVMASAL